MFQNSNEKGSPFTQLSMGDNRAQHVFRHDSSAGNNNQELARILIALDFAFKLLKWDDVTISSIVTGYQASIDAKYHDDYKAIATIEELDRRMAMRRSSSLLNNQLNQPQGQP